MTYGEDPPSITNVPPGRPLEYADPYTPPPEKMRRLAEPSPFRQAVRRNTVLAFALLAMLSAMTSWVFAVRSLTTGSAESGILGFVLALAGTVLMFVGDQIALPGAKSKLSLYAGIMSVGSLLFAAFAKVMLR